MSRNTCALKWWWVSRHVEVGVNPASLLHEFQKPGHGGIQEIWFMASAGALHGDERTGEGKHETGS